MSRPLLVASLILAAGAGAVPVLPAGAASLSAGLQRSSCAQPPGGYRQYESLIEHYCMIYPSGWRLASSPSAQYFFGEIAERFRTNVTVIITKVPRGAKLAQFARAEIAANDKLGARVQSHVTTRVAGRPAWSLRGQARVKLGRKSIRDRFESVVFLARGKGWQITLSSARSVYGRDHGIFDRMLRSLKLTH